MMKTYDGLYDCTGMLSNEDEPVVIKPINLTDTLVEIDKTNRETINALTTISNHLFGETDTSNLSADANCFAEQLEKNLKMAHMISDYVASIRGKIGA